MSFFHSLMHHANVFTHAWKQRKNFIESQYSREELEFLPAALEVQQTPPSPIGRMIIWLIISFVLIAVIWALLGKVDIVAVAQGRIIPAGKSKVIQAFDIGKVIGIHIEEGQRVAKGDLLLELDPSITKADQTHVLQELSIEKAIGIRLSALEKSIKAITRNTKKSVLISSDDIGGLTERNEQQAILNAEFNEYTSKLKTYQETTAQHQARAETLNQQIKKLKAIIPLITKRTDAVKKLLIDQYITETEYLKLEQERIESVQTLAEKQSELNETQKRISQARAQYNNYKAEFTYQLLQQKADGQRKIANLQQELKKATNRQGLQRITSPVNGQVQQLNVHTIGAVVKPAEPLMMIIPETQGLEIEAFIENKDIGFIYQDQEAEIKIDAFPFTKYGTIEGKIITLSNDAIENEKLGWTFLARVSMDKTQMNVDGKRINLTPGMSASVEIKTGKRRLIEFFMSPLLKGANEAVRER